MSLSAVKSLINNIVLNKESKKNAVYFFGFIISFFIGFFSNKLVIWNYDVFYVFSQLLLCVSLILVLINILKLPIKKLYLVLKSKF